MKKVSNFSYGLGLLLLMSILTFSLLYSCKKDNGNTFKPTISLEDSSNTLSVPGKKNVQYVEFISNTAWEASSEKDWITLSKTEGEKGSNTLEVSIEANKGDESRVGKIIITLNKGSLSKEIICYSPMFRQVKVDC